MAKASIRKQVCRTLLFFSFFFSACSAVSAREWLQVDPDAIPTAWTLNDVWISASVTDDQEGVDLAIFSVGDTGTILLSDGVTWEEQETGVAWNLNGVWGISATSVFVVGDTGTILYFDGETWTKQDSGTPRDLNDVWATSLSDVYAVGDSGTILHYDGAGWEPLSGRVIHHLNGVWGDADDDIFAVGDEGTIIHFDGETWEEQDSGTNRDLNGVWGSSPENVYAVGENGTILLYDGLTWTSTFSDPLFVPVLHDVWGTSPCNIYAVGEPGDNEGTILHFDGSAWSDQNGLVTMFPGLDTVLPLKGIHGASIRDIYTVGDLGFVLEFDPEAALFPTLCSISPASDAEDVAIDASISAVFSSVMNPATITTGTFTLSGGSGNVAGDVAYDSNTAVFTPEQNLAYATTYKVTLSDDIQDNLGVSLEEDFTWSFTTASEPADSGGSCFISAVQ